MSLEPTRYWLRISGLPWQEASRDQFVAAEHRAGFYPNPGCGPVATGGFGSGPIEGRVTYGEIKAEDYAGDPDFAKAINKFKVS
jgi:hypothetical protein